MTSSLPIVFIVEDDCTYQQEYAVALRGKVTIVSAKSLSEAGAKWEQHKETVALVVMDACVDKPDDIDTVPLVGTMRRTFSGPILTTSSYSKFNDALLAAGCNYEVTKKNVPEVTLDLLGLS